MTYNDRLITRIHKLRRQIIVLWAILIALIIVMIYGLFLVLGNQAAIMVMQTDALDKLEEMRIEQEIIEAIPEPAKAGPVSLGEFTITHYSASLEECGKTDGITATGAKAVAGRTIAVDPDIIPLGSQIIIDGITYTAEDVGGKVKGKRIDIFVDSRKEAIQRGKIQREVRLAT
jgi:3D (Asp-Asp-Asp) domain-containing protein